MASASTVSPDETLRTSRGKDKFTRLARLLICGGTRILREYFDSCHSPANLAAFLRTSAVKQRLKNLKRNRVLNLSQWKVLYPSSTTCGKSESFDITLLFTLIRELVVLTPPALGWDKLPADTDLTLPADLARIKYYRNTVYAHASGNMELTNDEFDDYWDQLERALLRIVKSYAGNTSSALKNWETAINNLFQSPISKEFEVNDLLGSPQAELAIESRYFQNLDSRQSLFTYIEAEISDRPTRSEVTKQIRTINEEKNPKEVSVRCNLKTATWGAVVGGTMYIFYRYKDDPEELRKMIIGALLPVAGILVGTIAIGSIKIGIQAESLEALEGLLIRYKSGKLEKDLAKVFMTEELKKATNGEAINFSVEMNENDYRIAYCQMLRREAKIYLQKVEKERDSLKRYLDRWIDCSREVTKKLYDHVKKLSKLKVIDQSTVGAAGAEVGKQKIKIIRAISKALDIAIKGEKTTLPEVESSIGEIKDQVKCLKYAESQRLLLEIKPAKSSSEFDKTFQIEKILVSLELPPQCHAYAESLEHMYQRDISEVEKEVLEMAENLEAIALDKDEAHDFVEKYLDELFMCLSCTYHGNNRLKRLEKRIEIVHRLYVKWIDNRQEVRRELTKLADKLNEHQKNVNIAKVTGSSAAIVGTGLTIGGFVASFFMFGASFIASAVVAAIAGAGGLIAGGAGETKHFLDKKICKDAQKCIYQDINLTKRLQYHMDNLEEELKFIKKDELEGINLKLADDLTIPKRSIKFEPLTLGKMIFYESIQATKGAKESFGTGASKLRQHLQHSQYLQYLPHGRFIKGANLALVDIYKFVQSSTSTEEAEKRIRDIVEEIPCLDREEVPAMITEYITETLLEHKKGEMSYIKRRLRRRLRSEPSPKQSFQ